MRRIRFLGHPLHPATVHVPFGLLAAVSGLDAAIWLGLGGWTREASWWLLAAALASAAGTATTGLLDYVAVPKDHPGGGMANLHLGLVGAALSAYALSLALRATAWGPAAFVGLAGLLLLLAGGWAGGEMVYGHGIGVRGAEEHDPP